ncbi:MAG: hypothetical protein EB084_18225 [Proteobacteria bacterium]|nr:hypothetical protein [Pseudomonadota bacterium]
MINLRLWRSAALALMMVLLSMGAGMVRAADEMRIVVDGQPATFEVPPVDREGVVCVPMKGVFARLGAVVNYDNVTHTVKALRGKTLILLTLGSDTATVNLKPFKLQVAPFMSGGAIMVPLRFVGEALGAQISYDAATRVVSIRSGKEAVITLPTVHVPAASPTPIPSPTPEEVRITEFRHSASGLLHPGDTLHVTLVGTPNAQASFSVPGLADKVALKEGPEGTYAIDYKLGGGVTLRDAPVFGVLQKGTQRAPLATAPVALTVQPLVPHLDRPSPGVGARVLEKTPRITAFFEMLGGTLDVSSVRVLVNGSDVSKQAYITREFFTYVPAQPIEGIVKVEVSGQVTPPGSAAAAPFTDGWSFSTASSTATTPMTAPPTASPTPAPAASPAPPSSPDALPLTVTSPVADALVSSTVKVQGKTAAGARVKIDLTRRVPVLEHDVRLAGGEATADDQGMYTIDIALPWTAKGARLNVVARARDAAGRRSAPVVVTVNGR